MKNIHVLPTDKPSRLAGSEYITNEQGIDKRVLKFKLWDKLIPNKDLKDVGYIPQNIYITSDEEIKEGDWIYENNLNQETKIYQIIKRDGRLMFFRFRNVPIWLDKNQHECKKIILTTDDQLIKDGVQSIDDEFLEWFVKNPTCEFVQVQWVKTPDGIFYHKDNVPYGYYKIIIPQEESKTMRLTPSLKQQIDDYFNNTPEEEIQRAWDEVVEKTKGVESPMLSEFLLTLPTYESELDVSKLKETLEEAACKDLGYNYNNWVSMHSKDSSTTIYCEVTNWCKGAKSDAARAYWFSKFQESITDTLWQCWKASSAYTVGSHKDFKQTHPNFNEWFEQFKKRNNENSTI